MSISTRLLLDKTQLSQLINALRKPMTSASRYDFLKFLQPLTIFIGACWALFLYFSFQQTANSNTLEQQRLAVQQAQITLKSQEQSEAVALEHKKLTVQQTEIALQTQEEREQRALEQQELLLQQAQVTLEIQKTQRSLRQKELEESVKLKEQEVELSRLKQKQTQHQVEYDTTYRAITAADISVYKLKDEEDDWATYRVSLDVGITNKSSAAFEISILGIEYYIGNLPTNVKLPSNPVFASIGQPQSWWNSGRLEGEVVWRRVGSDGGIAASAVGKISEPWNYVEDQYHLRIAGSGTGVWKPEETAPINRTFVVRAHKDSFIGFGINLCFNRAEKPDEDLYYHFRHTQLSDPENQKNQK